MIDLKKIALTIGIGIVFALFIYFAIEAVAPSPKYEDFCAPEAPVPVPQKLVPPESCPIVRDDRSLSERCYRDKGMIRYEYNQTTACPLKAACDYCNRDYRNASDQYNLRAFWISGFIGLVALILGMYLPLTVEAIASGFMVGGILTIIQSTIRVFEALGRYSRVIVLGVELILLVWIGIKKVSDVGKQKKEAPHARTPKRLRS